MFAPGLQEPRDRDAGVAPPAAQPRPGAAGAARRRLHAPAGHRAEPVAGPAGHRQRGRPARRRGWTTAAWCAGTWTRCSRARYPADVLEHLGADAPRVEAGDMAAIATPMDFLGVNYYIAPRGQRRRRLATPAAAACALTDMGWEVYPQGLTELLLRLHRDYAGAAAVHHRERRGLQATRWSDGRVHDADRIAYLARHIAAVADALAQGVPMAGYMVWSLLDNFEWASRLRQALRHRARGLRDAAAHAEGQRALVPRLPAAQQAAHARASRRQPGA